MPYVMMPIPENRVMDVYRLLNEGSKKEPHEREQVPSQIVSKGWTEEQIERACRESPPAMKALLRTLARHPGEWLSTADLSGPVSRAVRKDYGWMQLAGVLGAFGRRSTNRYKMEDWFFEVKRDHENDRWVYRMSPTLAALIEQLLAED